MEYQDLLLTTKENLYYATLLGTNTELRQRMGQKANERIISKFDWKVTVENYTTLYQKVLSEEPTESLLTFQYLFSYNIAKTLYQIRFNFVNIFPEKERKELKRKIFNLFGI
jgi:hypothetical protein